MRKILFVLAVLLCLHASAQMRALDHEDFDVWNTIEGESISPDGKFVLYHLERGERDHYLKIRKPNGKLAFRYDRGSSGRFTYDGRYAIFVIKPWRDSIDGLRRRGVKKKELPLDSLGIYDLKDRRLTKIPRIKSYKLPRKWSGYLAYQYEPEPKKKEEEKESEGEDRKPKTKKPKEVSSKNGFPLVIRELATGIEDTIPFVTDYRFAEEGNRLAYSSTGPTKDSPHALFVYDPKGRSTQKIHEMKKGTYFQITISKSGKQLGFVTDPDSTKTQVRPTRLYWWTEDKAQADLVLEPDPGLEGLRPSRYENLEFSEDEKRMIFGLEKPPVLRDTALLKDEIVEVEVWTYNEPRLYTVQEMQVKNDTVKGYAAVYDLETGSLRRLADKDYPDIALLDRGNADFALLSSSLPYELESQWTGRTTRDYALVSLKDGTIEPVFKAFPGRIDASPSGRYLYGYHPRDSVWQVFDLSKQSVVKGLERKIFYDELNDLTRAAGSYGAPGWTENDEDLILYDRYDIWRFDPDSGDLDRLTSGRERKTVYRYVQLDPEERSLSDGGPWLLTLFDERDKSSGYARLDPKTGALDVLVRGPYRYGRPRKARQADVLWFTRESFTEFPDIRISGPDFRKPIKISDANPQQKEYRWGSIELVQWSSLDGRELSGLLVKPADFDPTLKYPLIVNYYEKSSNGLHNHRAPYPHRSTINYTFYASRGYLIFNPDVYYRDGYPGESAYNCVIPGINSLIEKGYVDKDRIGMQGHSWGGYQAAYLVTRTNMFRAVEAGAPVVNMFSAYGGIRWGSGLSRQFQYERTQSRIGGTPWEYPLRYLENSPVFDLDKIETPLLIMHNDNDGAVPWYQGIEFFTGLRRLGKPAWLLNYRGEPHWPLKRQNRRDFNLRMAQFFDYYLKDAPMPVWMERGVPAAEIGVNQGYGPVESEPGKAGE